MGTSDSGITVQHKGGKGPVVVDATLAHYESAADLAAQLLGEGTVVALPTETVYGLAGLVFRPEAVQSIYELKARPVSNPLIVHIFDFSGVDRMARLSKAQREVAWQLAQVFWPGPLTLVVESRHDVPLAVRGGRDTVALRVPSHPFFREVLARVQGGIAAPSANVFGHISPTSARDVAREFSAHPLTIFDGGACRVGIESSIVRIDPEGRLRILRPGVITAGDLSQALGDSCRFAEARDGSLLGGAQASAGEPTAAPGNYARHYAPTLPTFLCEPVSAPGPLAGEPRAWGAFESSTGQRFLFSDVVVLDYASTLRAAGVNTSGFLRYLDPAPSGDPVVYTQGLFAALREAEGVPGARAIVLHFSRSDKLKWSEAICDRLGRASSGASAKLVLSKA